MTDPKSIAEKVAVLLGAVPADVPGLWWLPGYPELTTGQLLQIAGDRVEQLTRMDS
jgi:hypothetical protein